MDEKRQVLFYNECHLGDCLWSLTFFRSILEANDISVVFYANPDYLPALKLLVHPDCADRISLQPLSQADKNRATNTWLRAPDNTFHENMRRNRHVIHRMCFDMFRGISERLGLAFPMRGYQEFAYDHPLHLASNPMLEKEGAPEFLLINSTPMSHQFTKNDEDFFPLYNYLRERKTFVTRHGGGFPCTLDYGLSLLQIGQVAVQAKTVIGIDTGPLCACINKEALRKSRRWYTMVWKHLPEVVWNEYDERFVVCSSVGDVVEHLKKEDKRPEVSVLMSLYHGEKYLAEHLRRFARQTFFDKAQLVICHNCPTDKELGVIREFDANHPGTIKHIVKNELTTWSESMNECAKLADADLLAIGNVDDIRSPDSLHRQVEFLRQHPDYDVVHGNNMMVKTFGSDEGWQLTNAPFVDGSPELLQGMRLGPFFMWRKSAMEKCGYFDEQFLVSADFDLAMRFARRVKIGSVDMCLGSYLDEGVGLSTRGDGVEVSERTAIKIRYGQSLYDDEKQAAGGGRIRRYSLRDVRWFGTTHKDWIQDFLGRPSVSVIVSSYNQLEALKLALESLYLQMEPPLEVIVTDDGSTDGTIEWLDEVADKYPFPLRYMTRRHDGYRLASLQNLGARKASGSRLLFTNADVLHCPLSVKAHADLSGNLVGAGIVCSISEEGASKLTVEHVMNYDKLKKLVETYPDARTNLSYGRYDLNRNPLAVWGGNFSVPVSAFNRVDGFDEGFDVGWGGEDASLSKRCHDKAGSIIVWVEASVVHHLGHPRKSYCFTQRGSMRWANLWG